MCCLVVLCCGLWNGGGACEVVWSRCLFSSSLRLSLLFLFLFVLVFGVVRAQPGEHARYPRTPLCSLLSTPRLSSSSAFPVIVEWRRVIHHVLVCCVGMTAMGSLSRSSSFF